MKKIFYEKQGRRYVPVAEYDSEWVDSFPKGAHLIVCHPGGTSRRFNIDPNYAAMIAAGRVAEEAICHAMNKASELRPAKTPLTERQRQAWNELSESFGEEISTLHGASVHDIVQAGVRAMQAEADKLMTNEGVKKAYENFLLMCELAKERDEH